MKPYVQALANRFGVTEGSPRDRKLVFHRATASIWYPILSEIIDRDGAIVVPQLVADIGSLFRNPGPALSTQIAKITTEVGSTWGIYVVSLKEAIEKAYGPFDQLKNRNPQKRIAGQHSQEKPEIGKKSKLLYKPAVGKLEEFVREHTTKKDIVVVGFHF